VSKREIHRKVSEKLSLMGLGDLSHRRARDLSGGEKQRVAIARALVLEPEVLMLDEPTAHMDRSSIRQLEKVLRKLHEAGTTILMSSHQLELAYRLADRLVIMEEGKTIPNRQNIFKGRVLRQDERFTYFQTEGGQLRCPAQSGDFTTAVFTPEDVILSEQAIDTSAQNQFRGRVSALNRNANLIEVELDCGFPLKACITEYSRTKLKVEPGRSLIATFKASAIRLY
jgi:molybdopterin-binding protein